MKICKSHMAPVSSKAAILTCFSVFVLFTVLFHVSVPTDNVYGKDPGWVKMDKGLFLCEFDLAGISSTQNEKITIIKISPEEYALRLLCSSEHGIEGLTINEWCKNYGMIAAINAGMFLPDRKTNVGYMKNFGHINNGRINSKYHSVAAFNPVDNSLPAFKIFDSDEKDIRDIIENYNTVIQNLRLIKSPGENRWTRQNKKWSEAALGEDKNGNVLFIFSRMPFTMYDFNKILLSLPIDIVSAQHLEGGPEASLYFSYGKKEIHLTGGFETGFNENNTGIYTFGIPNVIGFSKISE